MSLWRRRTATVFLIVTAQLSAANDELITRATAGLTVDLPPPTMDEWSISPHRDESRKGPIQIGFGRDLDISPEASARSHDLVWEMTPNGKAVTAIIVRSPGAAGLRAQLFLEHLPRDLAIGFYDPHDIERTTKWISAKELEETSTRRDDGYLYWSPTIAGDRIGIELQVSSGTSHEVVVSIPRISHLNQTLDDPQRSATFCPQTDAVCRSDRISDIARNAVAKYLFTNSAGDTSNCTGTLLNDQDLATQIPYFITANHCVKNADQVASSEFYWFHETPVCGDDSSLTTLQRGRGATELARDGWFPGSDMVLMRLREKPPFGVGLAGWTSERVALRDAVVGVHHPNGVIKKILIGDVVPHSFPGSGTSHALIRATEGASHDGSSGSGIWRRSATGQDYLVGTISASSDATCPTQERVSFGRLSVFHPRISNWIGIGSAPEEAYVGGHVGFILREPLGPVLMHLDDGDEIDLSVVGTGPFNIQADFSLASHPTSAKLELDGPRSLSRTTNTAPHRLITAGGGIGLTPGSYTLTAVAYDGADGSGVELETQTIAFTVIGTSDDADRGVGSLWLADSSDGTLFGEITDGGMLVLNRNVDASLEIRAATSGTGSVASVGYALSGPVSASGTANGAPFAWPVALTPGTYSLRATPYPTADGVGAAGTSLTRTAFTVAFSPTLVPIHRLVLVDGSDGASVMHLLPGAVLDLDDTNARSFNIRAELTPGAAVETVQLDLAGPVAASRVSTAVPHTLHGATGGGPLIAGDYTITATPYASAITDPPLPARSVSFKVVGGVGETDIAVTRLTLIDGNSGVELATLTDGTLVNAPTPSGTQLAIRADTEGATVGSVGFGLTGPTQVTHTANEMPFIWQGTLTPGTYSIIATPYPQTGLTGQAGDALTVANVEVAYAYSTALEAVTLVDSGTSVDTDVATLVDGATVDLSGTSKRMKFRVDLVRDRAASVGVVLSGPVSGTFLHKDDQSFWLLGETAPGDAAGRAMPNGNYSLTLTLYEGPNGTGYNSTKTLHFTITGSFNSSDSPLAGFTIVDAEGPPPDGDVATVSEGARIDMSSTSARSLTFRAELANDPRRLAGVTFELSGPVMASKRENGAEPYSLYGEKGAGDFRGALLPSGNYTITATPYSAEPALDPITNNGNVRLVDGGSLAVGRVEIKQNRSWGTVCDVGWDLDDADVVCAQLGLGEALSAPGGAAFGRGTGPINLGNVQCAGDESRLLACSSGGTSGCDHGQDAGAICTGVPQTALTRRFTVVNSTPRNPVVSFTAIRAGQAPTELGTVVDGGTLDLSGTGMVPLTFRADMPNDVEHVGSVRLTLHGSTSASRVDNNRDYTLHTFNAGSNKYSDGVELHNGEYTLEATVFSGVDGTGTSFGTVTTLFRVVGSENLPASVTGFALIDPRSPKTIRTTISDGTTLDLDALVRWAPWIDIQPMLSSQGSVPGSVRLELTGATTASRLAEDAPFRLFSADPIGNEGGRLATGVHTLHATTFSRSGGQGSAGRSVAVQFTVTSRPLSWDDFELGQPISGTFFPSGLYSDGATTWVADLNSARVLAYRSWDAVRKQSRDIVSAASQAAGLWSDGETLLVSDYDAGKIVAHRLSNGVRQQANEIQLVEGNSAPSGIWSDGDALLVADYESRRVFGYDVRGNRRPSLDLDLSAHVERPWGIWSNGNTLWVADWFRGGVRAFAHSDRSRQPSGDVDTIAAGNPNPGGIHSDGVRLWTTDTTHRTIHAYRLPIPKTESEVAQGWTTTMTVGKSDGRGFSTLAHPDVGYLEDITFMHEGETYQIQIIAATSEGVTFKTRNRASPFNGFVLEWGGEVLPLDDSDKGANSTFTWNQTWLDTNAPTLADVNYETSMPNGGSETVCLRVGIADCPVLPEFDDGTSATRSVAENSPTGTLVGAAIEATHVVNPVVRYSLAGSNASNYAINGSTGQLTSAAVFDHEADSSHSITVSAFDDNGVASSIPVTISISDVNEPPGTPSAPDVSGVSSSSLTVSWTTPENVEQPPVNDYDIRYASGTDEFADWAYDGTATATTISGLSADTQYQVQVLAKNAEGNSGWSASGEGRTLAEDDASLIAWFENVPSTHDGSTEFTLSLKFSAIVGTLVRTLRQDRLSVTNGTITGMKRVNKTPEGADEFTIRITPANRNAVTVSLPVDGLPCNAGGVCTPDGVQLSEGATTTVAGPATESDMRLVDGSTVIEGRVEIRHDGTWGTVCDDRFTTEDATVICRQLGYAGGRAHRRAAFGTGKGTIWVDDLHCSGSESRLEDCQFSNWGIHNCNHSEDASVSCESAFDDSLVSVSVYESTLTLRYERKLDGQSVPSPRDFLVTVNGSDGSNAIPVKSVVVVGREAILNLSRNIQPQEKVSVSYLPAPMHPLQDESYNAVPEFTNRSASHKPSSQDNEFGVQVAIPPEHDLTATPRVRLENEAKMEVLDLSSHGLVEASSLVGLTDVEVLNLSNNQINDLWPLASMTSLEMLVLRDNSVDDLSALGGLFGLRVLDLSGNAISDISPLANLTALRRLNLSGNDVVDLRPLSDLRSLKVLLLNENRVSDLVPLWGLQGLVHLGLVNNHVEDAAPLREAQSLRRLDLSGNRVRDVSVFGDLSKLKWLRLSGNPIADFSPLRRLTNVRWLSLDADTSSSETMSWLTKDRTPALLFESIDSRSSFDNPD